MCHFFLLDAIHYSNCNHNALSSLLHRGCVIVVYAWFYWGTLSKTIVSLNAFGQYGGIRFKRLHSTVPMPWLSLVMLNIWLRNKIKSLHPCVFLKIINLLRTCKYKIYTTVTFHVVNFKFTGRVWIQKFTPWQLVVMLEFCNVHPCTKDQNNLKFTTLHVHLCKFGFVAVNNHTSQHST